MSEFAKSFRDLDVYRRALDLAIDVHVMSLSFPSIERYALADQMRRASKSVCQNVAEAWRKRRYKASFIAKLSDSETEASETQCCLDIAIRLNYLDAARHQDLDSRYEIVISQLVTMINNADTWCKIQGSR